MLVKICKDRPAQQLDHAFQLLHLGVCPCLTLQNPAGGHCVGDLDLSVVSVAGRKLRGCLDPRICQQKGRAVPVGALRAAGVYDPSAGRASHHRRVARSLGFGTFGHVLLAQIWAPKLGDFKAYVLDFVRVRVAVVRAKDSRILS